MDKGLDSRYLEALFAGLSIYAIIYEEGEIYVQ